MKGTIKLNTPLTVNGKDRKELEYDFDAITSEDFCKAESMAHSNTPQTTVLELDASMHLYLTMHAITKADIDIDISDLKRIKGRDLVGLVKLGRNFITGGSDENESEDETSEEQRVSTREDTTQEQTL